MTPAPSPDAGGAARPFLSRAALGRVLGSLLDAEIAAARGRKGGRAPSRRVAWDEAVRLSADGPDGPGCDSLERLQLAAAVNEMFHLHAAGHEDGLLADDRFGTWLDAVEAAWAGGAGEVTFASSGSTGQPRRCTHPRERLDLEVTTLAAHFGDRRRIVALAPAHHIYGLLFTGLLADRLGVPVWAAEQAGAGALGSGLAAGDLVVSFPDRWAWLERSLPALPPGVAGVSSTAPCPAGLIHALRAKGLEGMAEVYGSSETAGIALRHEPGEPYRLMPHWRRIDGEAAGPAMLEHRSGWRVALPDHAAWSGPDLFAVGPRVDGAVQVGGVNVCPAGIAERLRACPGVAAAAVRLMRPEEGARLKAFVVPSGPEPPEELEARLIAWAERTLQPAERPRSVTVGPALPTSAMGKAADW